MQSRLLINLYTWQQTKNCLLRSSVGQESLSQISWAGLDRLFIFGSQHAPIHLAALHWTFSSFSPSFDMYGLHTGAQNSNCGLTRAVKALFLHPYCSHTLIDGVESVFGWLCRVVLLFNSPWKPCPLTAVSCYRNMKLVYPVSSVMLIFLPQSLCSGGISPGHPLPAPLPEGCVPQQEVLAGKWQL